MAEKLKKASRAKTLHLKPFLDEWTQKIERPSYIEDDPILFMHAYEKKEDQLLAGFFAALFAWGRRDVVIRKTNNLMKRMNYQPANFIRNFTEADAEVLEGFKHRTFKPIDLYWLIKTLSSILKKNDSFEDFWNQCYVQAKASDRDLIAVFHDAFFAIHPEAAQRTRKHISNPEKNSSSKRLYLYLRWAVRQGSPVDPGIMTFMPPSELKIPLDVHVARQARRLGLLSRSYNDWKAVQELTENLILLDPTDPAKYDYALFGLGIREAEIPEKFVVNNFS